MMRRSLAITLLLIMVESSHAVASMCSSRDGQKYCTCEYNQRCTSSENACSCSAGAGGELPQEHVLAPSPQPLRSLPLPRLESKPQREPPAPRPSAPAPALPPPMIVDNGERSALEYVQMARSQIVAHKMSTAIEFIDKSQIRILDRAFVLNKAFDPITDESLKQLFATKQALRTKDYELAVQLLDVAMTILQ